MSLENPGACGDSSSTGDINRNIRELLLEVRNQRSEINSLKEEVRGASQSVASEVKKIKSGNDIRWRFEGNRLQFEFNSEVADNLKQTLWGLENGKQEYAVEVLKESCDKLKTRNKHIRIADSSEGGWETVRQYISNPLASDSEDETRLSRAESRAVKKKKTQQKPKPKSKASAAYGYTDSLISICFFQEFSHKQLGPGLVPFVDTKQINAVPSTSDHVLPAANQITSAAHVHTPRVQCSSNQTPSSRNEADPVRDSLDIEDEYFSVGNDFDCDRFTQDYFEYEQGQKDIIVKNRLRNYIDF